MLGQLEHPFYHPATSQLLRAQTIGKLRRMFSQFRSPRKKIIALVALGLGLIWISQAIATVFLRESADPEKLKLWLPLGLLTYTSWHFIKLATHAVEEPFSWTGAEREFVLAAPLTRRQQITYRLISVFSAAFAKAVCFSILMLPDISLWYAGFVGVLLGLATVDLLRVSAELFFFGLGSRGRSVFRISVIGLFTTAFCYAAATCLFSREAAAELSSPGALVFFQHLFRECQMLAQSTIGIFLMAPFEVFSTIALSPRIDLNWALSLVLGIGMVGVLMICVYRVDQWTSKKIAVGELAAFHRSEQDIAQESTTINHENVPQVSVPFCWSGAGGLMWRQFLGAFHYRKTVAISLAAPVLLSCLPLLANHNPVTMLLHVVGGAIFYSFLLLPSALILDFRRDINRMTVLKSLPVHPLAMVIGQLAAPVTLCWLFQSMVLALAVLTGKVITWQALVASLLVLPVNVLIFSIENYIFLLSPYQRNKEGFDVFLRTVLTFTGKGILFALGICVFLTWALIAKQISIAADLPTSLGSFIFASGIWIITLAIASLFLSAIVRQFVAFDPSQDVPSAG